MQQLPPVSYSQKQSFFFIRRRSAMPVNGLLTIQDVSKRLNVPVETLRRWRRARQGPHSFKIGGQLRYRPESIERYIKDQEQKEAASA